MHLTNGVDKSWCFSEIAGEDPDRARLLESTDTAEKLIFAVEAALSVSFETHHLRIGVEVSEKRPSDRRIVVQFFAGSALLDWFMNAKTGYRAQFREHWKSGLCFNAEMVERLRAILLSKLGAEIDAQLLNDRFETIGSVRIAKGFVLTSLVPYLSKVWVCTCLLLDKGGSRYVPLSGGANLRIGGERFWAPFPSEGDAWLDLKGGFVGPSYVYQPKNPVRRARGLQIKMTA